MENIYDIVIIGAGPAGLAAGLYAGRAAMKTLIIEKGKPGGQIVITHEVANVPGAIPDASGPSLIDRMREQAEGFGAQIVKDTIKELVLDGDIKVVKGEKGEYKAKALIHATGARPRLLGIPGEKELTGKGVSYCATCDGAFFEEMEVFVVGGGDSAVEEAMFLTKFARKVTILSRDPELTCAKTIQEKAFKNEKIEILYHTEIAEIKGEGMVESMTLKDNESGETWEYVADEEDGTFGIFIFIGYVPQTELLKDHLELEWGYIKTDDAMRTGIEGVYAAGDCRVKPLRQVVTANADGAIAAVQAEKYIMDKFEDIDLDAAEKGAIYS